MGASDGRVGDGASRRPVLFVDRPPPGWLDELVAGRADVVGPEDAELPLADGVIAGSRHWDGPAMDCAPRLRVISRTGVGYDNVDVAAATARGIAVCYAPDAPTVSTAEHAVALLLAVTKDVAGWSSAPTSADGPSVPGIELAGRTLGLFGYGRIARRVAVIGRALDMSVLAHDPFPAVIDDVAVLVDDADELFARSDVVSLHAPATAATRHVVDARRLSLMPAGSFLVNCARGSLVDHTALVAALRSEHLAGAGLDVTEPEPLRGDHPLRAHPRVVITPHIASHTVVGRRRLYAHAVEHALAVLGGASASLVPEQCAPVAAP